MPDNETMEEAGLTVTKECNVCHGYFQGHLDGDYCCPKGREQNLSPLPHPLPPRNEEETQRAAA